MFMKMTGFWTVFQYAEYGVGFLQRGVATINRARCIVGDPAGRVERESVRACGMGDLILSRRWLCFLDEIAFTKEDSESLVLPLGQLWFRCCFLYCRSPFRRFRSFVLRYL